MDDIKCYSLDDSKNRFKVNLRELRCPCFNYYCIKVGQIRKD